MSATGALPGFRDFYPAERAERDHIFRAWRAVAARYAFIEYDGPPLEPLELYTRKSGEEIVEQLYAFTDKGGRAVALRPEMTPTFARMVAARANTLRKPLRWFSIPQLFRYERAQKGRLREHYQLNADIVGEAGEVADAELLAVAIDVMRELGLRASDVRARVSDRRLLSAALIDGLRVVREQIPTVMAVIDKAGREPREAGAVRLEKAGVARDTIDRVFALVATRDLSGFQRVAASREVDRVAQHIERVFEYARALGVGDWVDFDPSIVRGLAYYTGTVFELFDARGEFRAICGGGRYDDLLNTLGGVDLPALGFGMGDVVLGDLVRARGLMPSGGDRSCADAYIVAGPGSVTRPYADVLRLAAALRGNGVSADYALSEERYQTQAPRNQLDAAKKAGARAAVYFDVADTVTAVALGGRLADAPRWSGPAADVLAGGRGMVALLAWLRSL
jgi:histidyl-tRNA synthetase